MILISIVFVWAWKSLVIELYVPFPPIERSSTFHTIELLDVCARWSEYSLWSMVFKWITRASSVPFFQIHWMFACKSAAFFYIKDIKRFMVLLARSWGRPTREPRTNSFTSLVFLLLYRLSCVYPCAHANAFIRLSLCSAASVFWLVISTESSPCFLNTQAKVL